VPFDDSSNIFPDGTDGRASPPRARSRPRSREKTRKTSSQFSTVSPGAHKPQHTNTPTHGSKDTTRARHPSDRRRASIESDTNTPRLISSGDGGHETPTPHPRHALPPPAAQQEDRKSMHSHRERHPSTNTQHGQGRHAREVLSGQGKPPTPSKVRVRVGVGVGVGVRGRGRGCAAALV